MNKLLAAIIAAAFAFTSAGAIAAKHGDGMKKDEPKAEKKAEAKKDEKKAEKKAEAKKDEKKAEKKAPKKQEAKKEMKKEDKK